MFSSMVKQYITDGNANAIPNPTQLGYLCVPSDFLSELIRFLSMMQVLKVGVGKEVAGIKRDLELFNNSLITVQSDNELYDSMIRAINCMSKICSDEGKSACMSTEIELVQTYAWAKAGCILFLDHLELID